MPTPSGTREWPGIQVWENAEIRKAIKCLVPKQIYFSLLFFCSFCPSSHPHTRRTDEQHKVFPSLLTKNRNTWGMWKGPWQSLHYDCLWKSLGINIQDLVALLSILVFACFLSHSTALQHAGSCFGDWRWFCEQRASIVCNQTSNCGQNMGCLFVPDIMLQALPALHHSGSWPVTVEPSSCHPHVAKRVPCLIIHRLCPQVLVVQLTEYLPE